MIVTVDRQLLTDLATTAVAEATDTPGRSLRTDAILRMSVAILNLNLIVSVADRADAVDHVLDLRAARARRAA